MRTKRKHIRGIVDELINNAMKAKATSVNVEIEDVGHRISVTVTDNGRGMDSDTAEEARKHLKQPRRHELEEYYGALAGESMVGTGLSLVGMMVDGAEVETQLGKGTKVTVYFDTAP